MFCKFSTYFSFTATLLISLTFCNGRSLSTPFTPEKETPGWQEVTTVEELWHAYPGHIRSLLAALDLSRPGLEDVQSAVQTGDTIVAGEALLDYYRQADSGYWLRSVSVEDQENEASIEEARQLVNDTVSFSGVTARVLHSKDGGWQWDYRGPEHDEEFGYSLNGHQYLPLLLTAWQQTGKPVFVEVFDRLIRDWIIHNPLPAKSDSIYLVLNTSDTLDWRDIGEVIWRDLEAGQRLGSSWPQTFYGFQQAETFTPAARLLMLSSIPVQAGYLREYHKKGHNWTTMEMNGLALAGLAFPEFQQAEDWATYALNIMKEEINRQVYPDGVQTELSTKTQWVALSRFESLAQNFQKANRPVAESYIRRLEEMYNYLAYAMRPDGHQPLNNDSDREDLRPRVLKAAQIYQRPDWQWIATNGAAGRQPEGLPSVVFPWAGIHVMRNGWDAQAHWAFFDTGPFGTGHQHSDKLHLSIAAYGRDLLVDGGRYTHKNYWSFDPTTWRGYFRSSFSHNVVLVDGKGQNGGPTTVASPMEEGNAYINSPAFDYARGTFSSGFNGVEGKVLHSRAVLYVRDRFWVVVDQVETDQPRKLQALWHYAPTCMVTVEAGTAVSTNAGEGNLRIVPASDLPWQVEKVQGKEEPYIQGWYSGDYGKKEPNPTMVYTVEVEGPVTFAWVLVPAKGEVPQVEAKLMGETVNGVQVLIEEAGEQPVKVTVPVKKGSPKIE